MYYLYLIILLFFIILIFVKLYIKIKYKFWAYQPVFHKYNLFYKFFKTGIINNELPEINKYCNFCNVLVSDYEDLEENTLQNMVDFLNTHYNEKNKKNEKNEKNENNENINNSISLSNFSSYFIGTSKSFISGYYGIEGSNLSGIMTTRPLNITLNKIPSFKLYYADFLCVHRDYKNKDIIQELIQTHEYIQRHKNKKINVLLLKYKENLPGVIALTTYKTYQFEIKHIPKQPLPHASMQIIEINKQNIRLLITFIYSQKNKFNCFILPDMANLLNLINNKTYIVYVIIQKNIILACYFFRDCYMQNKSINKSADKSTDKSNDKSNDKSIQISRSINLIECFASINNCQNEFFISGFYNAIKKINARLITIENISHNNIMINYLFLLNIISKNKNKISYFLYNYIKNPILHDTIFILT